MFAIVKDNASHHFVVTVQGFFADESAVKEHIETASRTPDFGRGVEVIGFDKDHDAAVTKAEGLNKTTPPTSPTLAEQASILRRESEQHANEPEAPAKSVPV
jgi:hypothetical protein